MLSCPPIAAQGSANKARRGESHLILLPSVTEAYFSQDYEYLSPIIKEIESESKERDDLEAMVVSKRKK